MNTQQTSASQKTKGLRLVAYQRTSTDDKGQNPERQGDVIAATAARDGHTIVATITDEGTSGGVPVLERVWFREAIKVAKKNDAQGIIVESVDRLTRGGVRDYVTASMALEMRHGLQVVLADIPAGMDGMVLEIYVMLRVIIAKEFRDRLREQITTGLARAKREGWKNGRPGRRPKPNLSPDEIAYVREQKAMGTQGRPGMGWGRMARELTRRRGALEVIDPKAIEKRTVRPSWLRMEWHRINEGSAVRTWSRPPRPISSLCRESRHNAATVQPASPEPLTFADLADAGGNQEVANKRSVA